MQVSQIVEIISTRSSKESALAEIEKYSKTNPELAFLLRINDGAVTFPGLVVPDEFKLLNKDSREFGKSIGWFHKAITPFKFLMTPEGAPSYSPAKKAQVLERIANSIAYDELMVLVTAIKGELIVSKNKSPNRSINEEKYLGLLHILGDETAKPDPVVTEPSVLPEPVIEEIQATPSFVPTEEVVQVPNMSMDSIVSMEEAEKVAQPVEVYVNPNDQEQIWKGKGRKPKWLTELIDMGADQELFKKTVIIE